MNGLGVRRMEPCKVIQKTLLEEERASLSLAIAENHSVVRTGRSVLRGIYILYRRVVLNNKDALIIK